MERIIAILLLLLACSAGYSQLKPLTKNELKTLIKESIVAKQEDFKDSWIICNNDNAYYKNDTLHLYGSIYNTSHIKDCCEYILWNFTTKQTIQQMARRTCEHMFYGTAIRPEDVYTIKIVQKKDKLILKRLNNEKLIDSYTVLGYSETRYGDNDMSVVITLVRQ